MNLQLVYPPQTTAYTPETVAMELNLHLPTTTTTIITRMALDLNLHLPTTIMVTTFLQLVRTLSCWPLQLLVLHQPFSTAPKQFTKPLLQTTSTELLMNQLKSEFFCLLIFSTWCGIKTYTPT